VVALGELNGALIAHGGTAGAVVELSLALLIVAIALAVWVGGRRDEE
jgi:hypothetical protein